MGQSIHKEKYAFRKVMLYGVQVHLPILSYKCWLVLYLKDVPKYLGRPIQCHVVCAMDGTSEDHIITAVSREQEFMCRVIKDPFLPTFPVLTWAN